jgi:Tfp pilus assembly protein PilF
MTSKWCLRFLFVFTVIVFPVLPAFAQGANTLQGKVITPGGIQPITPVRVTLTFSGRPIYETFTDLSGRFSFSGVAKGMYQLTAEGDNQTFETTTVYAEVSSFGSAPRIFTQDIQLRPMQGKPVQRAAVVSAFKQDVPKAARQALERAMKMTGEGKTQEALAEMQEAIKIFPEYFDAHLALGNHFLKASRFDEAISALDRARQINPKDERVYQSFGLVLMQQKNYAMAVSVFSEATRLNPVNPLNALMKATALIHQAYAIDPSKVEDREYILKRAERALKQASELAEEKLKADHLSLAMYYEMKNDGERAADELESHLRENPNSKDAGSIREVIKRLRSHNR